MVDAGVSVVLSKLHEVASSELTALLKVDDKIRNLQRAQGYLQAEIRGADQQRRGRASELLLLWARETRVATFNVEDAVDEFHLKVEAFQVKAKWGRIAWYRFAVNLLNGLAMKIFVRHVLSREIAKINQKIKEISQIKETYKIQSSPSELWSLTSIDADIVWDTEDDNIDFRQGEFDVLKNKILDKSSESIGEVFITHRAIISILGASGTGKTRLARKLYNDHEVNKYFEVFAWICLPPRVRFEQYVDMILDQIRPQVKKELPRSPTEELQELLKGPRYLIVLDGLVDTCNWNSLLDLLPGENPKSRILITTQLKPKEIKHADPKMEPIVLEPLDDMKTTMLFSERVFGAGGHPPWLEHQWKMVVDARGCRRFSGQKKNTKKNTKNQDFSERIHNVTRGLPLAVIVLGGILRTKAYPSEWEEVFSQKLETSMRQPKAMRCLWLLAFEELPNHLKTCFLYLATAAENVILDPARMVRL